MVTRHNYILVHTKPYPTEEDEKAFVLSFAHGDVYASRDVNAEQLRKLQDDIADALEDWVKPARTMEYEDLGLTDPDNIPF